MSQLNVFYRAFKNYRDAIKDERESKLLRKEIVNKEADDKVVFTQSICNIDEDWVKAIEAGLIYIGKCIDEDRQFIRSEGTIDPIEKVRHVSRETSEHLAKHSNFITHVVKNADGEDELMPDKLYTVERLNNYAVYENRFLYMVLCSLDDFVSVRYNRIVRETNAYHGVAHLHKSVTAGKRRIEYTFDLDESSDDDPFLRSRSSLGAMLERLERIQRSLYYYMHTPLILEVAKSDKLKPPVTKTNVLRMDKNFKEVVTLYEYIAAYTGDGFTVTKQEHAVDFKKDDAAEQFSEPVLLLSFLAYEHGMDLGEMLKEQFEQEEAERRAAEEREFLAKLAEARARLKARQISPEEYILMLEKRVSDLEKGQAELISARERIETLERDKADLQQQVAARDEEIARLNEQHAEELLRRDEQYNDLKFRFDEQASAHAAELGDVRAAAEEQIARLTEAHEAAARESGERLKEANDKNAELLNDLDEQYKKYAVMNARLTALRKQNGLITDTEDFTSGAAFTELERELEIFNQFVRGEWKSAKQLLRREILGSWKKTGREKAEANKAEKKNAKKNKKPKAAETAEANDGWDEVASEAAAADTSKTYDGGDVNKSAEDRDE